MTCTYSSYVLCLVTKYNFWDKFFYSIMRHLEIDEFVVYESFA